MGSRYGSIHKESGRSIANLEFDEALAKRIPIYVFVLKDIIAILPVWRANRDADYHGVVDSTELFEFVDRIYRLGNVWVNSFGGT